MTIVAECGQNHLGDMERARQLIMLAKENGADLAKFQLYDHKSLYKDYPDIPNVELSKEQAFMLFNYGKEIGMEVFFSVFDAERVKWCEEIGVKRYKIASRLDDETILDAIKETGKEIIISYDPDYDKWGWDSNAKVLYCKSRYPAFLKDLQFTAGMFEDTGGKLGSSDGRGEYHREYAGYSDHTIGLEAAKIALARGAEIIEKHFSLCCNIGIDGKWSMTPEDLRELKRWEHMVKQIL